MRLVPGKTVPMERRGFEAQSGGWEEACPPTSSTLVQIRSKGPCSEHLPVEALLYHKDLVTRLYFA